MVLPAVMVVVPAVAPDVGTAAVYHRRPIAVDSRMRYLNQSQQLIHEIAKGYYENEAWIFAPELAWVPNGTIRLLGCSVPTGALATCIVHGRWARLLVSMDTFE